MTTVQQAFLGSFEKELIAEIEEVSVIKQSKSGEIIMDIGQYIKAMPLVLDGVIKIIREDKKEDELLLYFLEKGDICALSIARCIGTKKSEIRAIADVHTTVAMIPNQYLDSWMGTYKTYRINQWNQIKIRKLKVGFGCFLGAIGIVIASIEINL